MTLSDPKLDASLRLRHRGNRASNLPGSGPAWDAKVVRVDDGAVVEGA